MNRKSTNVDNATIDRVYLTAMFYLLIALKQFLFVVAALRKPLGVFAHQRQVQQSEVANTGCSGA
jgi:hypothetical protein